MNVETPSPEDLTGRTLAGRYRVERPLRRGGMGAVYVARDLTADRDVALKVIRQSLIEDPQALARFKREARLGLELSHVNVVRSFDTGDDGGLMYIAMELLQGDTLRERLDTRGRMTWQETLPLIEQIVRALNAAHDKGIIHRDLKPENIVLVDAGTTVKLLDFGVAKQARVDDGGSSATNMTGTGLIIGTPGYVAPEVVLEGRTDDARSDFYALGVVWFEMLTGQKPFTAKTAFALAMRHAHEAPPTPTSFLPYSPVPGPIERLVVQLMGKTPEQRPASTGALLATLATLADESQRALTVTPMPDSTVPTLTDAEFNAGRTNVMPMLPGGTPRPTLDGGTPATAMQRDATSEPHGTPVPAGPWATPEHWRHRRRGGLIAGLMFMGLLVGLGAVLGAKFLGPTATPIPPLAGATTPVLVPPPVLPSLPTPTPVLPATPPDPPTPVAGVPPVDVEVPLKKPAKPVKPRGETPVPSPPTPPTPPTTPPKPTSVVEARVTLKAPAGWKIGLDGKVPQSGHQSAVTLSGTHSVVFIAPDGGVTTRRFTIRSADKLILTGPESLP